MLRGLETTPYAESGEPTVVALGERGRLAGDLTVYLREAPPEYVRDRQEAVLTVVESLEKAGVIDGASIRSWPKKVRDPSDGYASAAIGAYEEFVDAVGRRSLEPFFEEKSATGSADRVIVFPVVCVALGRDGELAGLYPHWSDGTHHSVEDGLEALATGAPVANLEA